MQECKPVKVPILVGVELSVDQCPKTQEEEEDMTRVLLKLLRQLRGGG
jgi:hypothetical protein